MSNVPLPALKYRTDLVSTDYKLALKSGFYDFTGARDFYREATTAAGVSMHKDVILRYIEFQALALAPLAPHWCEYIWQEVLHKVRLPAASMVPSIAARAAVPTDLSSQSSSIQTATWPAIPSTSASLAAAREYVRHTSSAITSAEAAQLKRKDKGKTIAYDPKKPKRLAIFVASAFPVWQAKYVELVRREFDALSVGPEAKGGSNDKELAAKVATMAKERGSGAAETKKAMPFVQSMRRRLKDGESGEQVLNRELGFDELGVLREMAKGLMKTTGCAVVDVVKVDEGGKSGVVAVAAGGEDEGKRGGEKRDGLPAAAESAVPGQPTFDFANIAA